MKFMPNWAKRYMTLVGLPAFAVSIASFIFSKDPFANSALTVSAFLVFVSACAIRGYFMMHAMGRGEL